MDFVEGIILASAQFFLSKIAVSVKTLKVAKYNGRKRAYFGYIYIGDKNKKWDLRFASEAVAKYIPLFLRLAKHQV